MSVEQQLANAVQASNNLAAAVNGKIGEIDGKVAEAKEGFDSFVATSDDRYKTHGAATFTVGGEWDKLYPVRISLRGGPVNTLNIYRPDTFENMGGINGFDPAAAPGTFTASIIGIGDSWGHRTPFYAFDSYHDKVNRFLGKMYNFYRIPALWVWLRGGGVSYRVSHDSLYIAPEDINIHNEETDLLPGKVSVYLGGFNHASYAVNFQPILAADIDVSLPVNGYIRGVA